MSVKMMGLVWDADLPRDEKFILLAYADHADHDGHNIYPSIATIARKTGYSERSVQVITRKLQEMGTMRLDGSGTHGTNKWTIVIANGCICTGAETAPVQKITGGGAENTPLGVQPTAPEPSLTINKPSAAQAPKKPLLDFRDPEWDLLHGKEPEVISPEEAHRRDLQNALELFAFAPEYAHLLRAFIEITGIAPVKADIKSWNTALKTMREKGIAPEDIHAAVKKMRKDRITIKDPFSVMGTAADARGIRKLPKAPQQPKSEFATRLETGNYMKSEQFAEMFPERARS
jgi:hypothetical protein